MYWLPDDTVMYSLLTRTVVLAFVFPFCCNDTTPDCNFPTKEVSQIHNVIISGSCAYYSQIFSKARGHLLFSNYSQNNLPKPGGLFIFTGAVE